MNDDLISRSALRKDIERLYSVYKDNKDYFYTDVLDHIDNAPTVDIEPFVSVTFDKDELNRITDERVIEPIKNGELVIKEKRPTGHWIIEECSLGKTYYCSECYAHPEVCFDFCPYCGADMRGTK